MGGACVGLATGGTRAEQGGAPRAGAAWLPSDRGRVGADVSGRTDCDVGVGCRRGGRQAPAGHQREAVAEKEPTDAAYPGSVAHERGEGWREGRRAGLCMRLATNMPPSRGVVGGPGSRVETL